MNSRSVFNPYSLNPWLCSGGAIDPSQRIFDMASPSGAASVGFQQAGDGAAIRSVEDELRFRVSIEQFGASPTATPEKNSDAVDKAIAFLNSASDYRGGVISIGRGNFSFIRTWNFTPYVTGQVFNITLEGQGELATNLDFSAAPSNTHGIKVLGQGVSFHIRDLSISGCPGKGVVMLGGDEGTAAFQFFTSLNNVRIQGCGSDGFYSNNLFMAEFNQVWIKNSTGAGANFQGAHTSIKISTSWVSDSGDAGWRIDDAIYASMHGCGSDRNLYGYKLTNFTGVLVACGAEDSVRDNFCVETSNALSTGVPTASQDVYLTMIGCFGFAGSKVGANQYANFLSALTADGRPISITLIGNVSRGGTPTAKALVLTAGSGSINIWGYSTMGNSFDTANVNTGGVLH